MGLFDYLGAPATGGVFSALDGSYQPPTRMAVLGAGLQDLAAQISGRRGGHLALLQQTSSQERQNAFERERLKRKESREEEKLRLEREQQERARGYYQMLYGPGPAPAAPATPMGAVEAFPGGAPAMPPTTPEGEIDWEAVQANPDAWEISEVDGQTVVRPAAGAAPEAPMTAPRPRVTPERVMEIARGAYAAGDYEQGLKLEKQARDLEDQEMQRARFRMTQESHAREGKPASLHPMTMYPVEGEPFTVLMDRQTRDPTKRYLRADTGEPVIPGKGTRITEVAKPQKPPEMTAKQWDALEDTDANLTQLESLVDRSVDLLQQGDVGLVGKATGTIQDFRQAYSDAAAVIDQFVGEAQTISEDKVKAGATWTPERWFRPGLAAKDYLLNTLAYQVARLRDPNGRISDRDYLAARESLESAGYAGFRTVMGEVKREIANRRRLNDRRRARLNARSEKKRTIQRDPWE